MRVSKKAKPLPAQVGGNYAVPLKNGMFGAIRVIEKNSGQTFIVLGRWWKKVPSSRQVLKCAPLQRDESKISKCWFKQDLPDDFTPIVVNPLTISEISHCRPEGTMIFQNAIEFADHFYIQLCRQFDPPAYAAEIEKKEKLAEARAEIAAEKKRKRKKQLTF